MELLYICMYQFVSDESGYYVIPSFGDHFWRKYLEVYDQIHIIGEPLKGYLDKSKLVKLDTSRIKIDLLPPNNSPVDWKNDRLIERELDKVVRNAKSIIIKPASRKGIIAIRIAKKYKKPYMIEMTGDLYTALKHHSDPLKRLYAPIIYQQIKRAIKDCKYGIYVTDHYLQEKYPIEGKTCGSSDAVIKELDDAVLKSRLEKISVQSGSINIGLVGFYHDKNKGIDTAIEAVSRINRCRIHAVLHILGNGNEQDRAQWYSYADKKLLPHECLVFPAPIIGIDNMFKWYDTMDIIILPSRSEGLPRTIVETISRACPCITSNVCGLQELIDSRWTHNPGDSDKLTELLNNMISSKDEMAKTARENFARAEYYLESIQTGKRISFMKEFRDYCGVNQ
jgi:glycosyltransferase involved in cell wall biosynthesis